MSEIVVKLDYFSVTVFLQGGVGHKVVTELILSDLLQLPAANSSEYFEGQGFGGRGYSQICFCPVSGLVLYRYPSGGDTGHCHVEIKGEPLTSIGFEGVRRFLQGLEDADLTFRASRIDVAFDNVPCSPVELFNAWKAGKVKTRLHDHSHDWRENAKGKTFYWGSVTSERQGICYDKRGFNRVELRCRQKLAEGLGWLVVQGDAHKLWQAAAAILNNMAEFPDDGNHWGWVKKLAAGTEHCPASKVQKNVVASVLVAKARERFMVLCSELAILVQGLGTDLETLTLVVGSITIDEIGEKKIRGLRKAVDSL
jgi:hypothetical protein